MENKENKLSNDLKGVDATEDLPMNESSTLRDHEYSEIKSSKKSTDSSKEKKSPPPSVFRHTFGPTGSD
jgi:hypothetical protein